MARVKTTGFLAPAMARARRSAERQMAKAISEAFEPPPPGMVRLAVSVTVSEDLLKDELALGAFLVRAAKKGLSR